MNFANPSAFWALLLAIPIVAVYLIRNRPSTQAVSTLLFWEQVADEPGATSFFKNLRHPGSLLIQLCLLLLLTLALSIPTYLANQTEANHRVLVIDNSASMQAVDSTGSSRFELAIARASNVIESMSAGSRLSIVVSCPSPQVICPPTTSRALAQSRLKTVQQTDCVGRLQQAIDFADSVSQDSVEVSTLAFTDGNDDAQSSTSVLYATAAKNSEAKSGSHPISVVSVGQPVANVGLTRFQVRRASTDPTLWHLLYEVSNFSDNSVAVNLEIRRDKTLVDVIPLNLKPSESRLGVLMKTSPEGGLITGTLQDSTSGDAWKDALSIDNSVASQLADRAVINVTLVTSGNWFLQQALSANPLVRLTVVDSKSPLPTSSNGDSVIVIDSTIPPDWSSETWPPEKNSGLPTKTLVVAPTQSCRLWTVNGEIETTFVGDYEKAHPLIHYVELEDIAINSASDVTLTEEAKAVVSALEGQPLLATYEAKNTKVLMLAVNLSQSDLPLRSSFPILLTNALGWLTDASPEMLPQADTDSAMKIANSFFAAVENSETNAAFNWMLDTPNGQTQPIAVADGFLNLGRLTRVGLYNLRSTPTSTAITETPSDNRPSFLLPCNLVSQQESRLNQPPSSAANKATESMAAAGSPINIQRVLLVLSLLAIIAECWLWHRRVIE